MFQPLTKYVITRQIYNLRDFGQVYVKAEVRDASSDELLLTTAMVEATDNVGRFKYQWTLPDDSSGTGRQLRVITVVYTDSGYTTRDLNYEVEETDVLVRDMNLLGGGGEAINYTYIQKLVKEVLDGQPVAEQPKFDDLKAEITKVVSSIKFPKETSLEPLYGQLEAIQKKIDELPKVEKQISYENRFNDLETKISELGGIKEELSSDFEEKTSKISDSLRRLSTILYEFVREKRIVDMIKAEFGDEFSNKEEKIKKAVKETIGDDTEMKTVINDTYDLLYDFTQK